MTRETLRYISGSHLISNKQLGYVEGCQIPDGIILAHETIHTLWASKKDGMLLKLDLSKAFDKLSLRFIYKVLPAFDLSYLWVNQILTLIPLDFFSIIVNGIPSKASPLLDVSTKGDASFPSFSYLWWKVLDALSIMSCQISTDSRVWIMLTLIWLPLIFNLLMIPS